MKVRVIVNRGGGALQGTAGDTLVDSLHDIFQGLRVEADVRLTPAETIRSAFLDAAGADDLDAVVAAGGDGTVSCAAGALAGTARPLGILPTGTLNHFARDAGIPTDIAAAAAVIAAGHVRAVDLGEVSGHIFVNNSAVGLYPNFVRDRDEQQRRLGRSKRLAMLWASLRALYRFSRRRLTIRVEGWALPIETPLLFVGNNRYETALLTRGRREALDHGELCLYAVLARSRRQFFWLGLRGLAGRLDQQRDFIALDGLTRAEIASRRSWLQVSTDGETIALQTPLRYRTRPGALRLLAPAEQP